MSSESSQRLRCHTNTNKHRYTPRLFIRFSSVSVIAVCAVETDGVCAFMLMCSNVSLITCEDLFLAPSDHNPVGEVNAT